jgi:hypothetical protein
MIGISACSRVISVLKWHNAACQPLRGFEVDPLTEGFVVGRESRGSVLFGDVVGFVMVVVAGGPR